MAHVLFITQYNQEGQIRGSTVEEETSSKKLYDMSPLNRIHHRTIAPNWETAMIQLFNSISSCRPLLQKHVSAWDTFKVPILFTSSSLKPHCRTFEAKHPPLNQPTPMMSMILEILLYLYDIVISKST